MQRVLLLVLLLIVGPVQSADAAELWETLPSTPSAVSDGRVEYADVNGIKMFYVDVGSGPAVVLLHGGLANSDYLSEQARAIAAAGYRGILVDSRGHGRSTRDQRPFGYDLMADDVLALLDHLKIDKAAIVGWSDGGTIGLDLAMRHPERVIGVFAFGAHVSPSGIKDNVESNPTFARYVGRAGREYARLSATPGDYATFRDQAITMAKTGPNWTDAQLRRIRTPIWVVGGEHDEGIKRAHTEHIAATIPGAQLVILPNVSHFAFLQDPATFNKTMLTFLGELYPSASTPQGGHR
jgi:pimeloyl-ACP methyl ester carboxylesterase